MPVPFLSGLHLPRLSCRSRERTLQSMYMATDVVGLTSLTSRPCQYSNQALVPFTVGASTYTAGRPNEPLLFGGETISFSPAASMA